MAQKITSDEFVDLREKEKPAVVFLEQRDSKVCAEESKFEVAN